MRGAVFSRYEEVFYVLGYADDAVGLARALKGEEERSPKTTRDKRIIYMERVASAPVHKTELRKQYLKLAKQRAKELPHIKEAP